MNTTVVLLLLFALLFVSLLIGMRAQRSEQSLAPSDARPAPDARCPACGPRDQGPPFPPGAHDQPPIIVLSEAAGFSFPTGKADVSPSFQRALRERITPELLRLARTYRCDIVDCVGHTDERGVTSVSNLDTYLLDGGDGPSHGRLVPGSNVDLGLMRCWEVLRFLKTDARLAGFTFYAYSAGAAILPSGAIAIRGQGPRDDPTRRRIEIRLRRAPGGRAAIEFSRP